MCPETEDLAGLDVSHAWDIVRQELSWSFVRFPYELNLVQSDLPSWLASIRERLNSGTYRSATAITFDTPKKGWMIRPGNYISLEDRVVFTACVLQCLPKILEEIAWSQGTHDFGWMPASLEDASFWLKDRRYCWRAFSNRALSLLRDPRYPVVLSTDIVGFYENISIETLHTDLAQAGISRGVANLIRDCLRTWSPSLAIERGLPQNLGASHILAKFYVNPIDRFLTREGYVHHRYVDDIMVYCADYNEAKRAIADLSRWLRPRGLTLSGEKSQLIPPEKARLRFEGALAKIARVLNTAVQHEEQVKELSNPYLNIEEIAEILRPFQPEVNQDSYEAALRFYFTEPGEETPSFDKAFFHFLLNGLGKFSSRAAVEYCLSLFATRPEETSYVLDYLTQLHLGTEIDESISRFMISGSAVYPYQIFQIAEWIMKRPHAPASELLERVRQFALKPTTPIYLRATCKAILGLWGDAPDLERLYESYADTGIDADRAATVVALRRTDRSRRNAFYGSIEGRSALEQRAVRYAMSLDGAN